MSGQEGDIFRPKTIETPCPSVLGVWVVNIPFIAHVLPSY